MLEFNMFPILGQKLKFFRERRQLSQLNLEMAINGAGGSISRIEKGRINPTKETVLKIAEVLELNNLEIDYLIGKTAEPASSHEIELAKAEVSEYFSKKSTLAYMTDERSRLIDMSKGFRLLTGISDDKWKDLAEKSFPIMLLRDEFGLRQFLDTDKLDLVLKHAFARTYTEMGFMKGDYWYEIIINELKKHPNIKAAWDNLENKKEELKVRTIDTQTVYFKYFGVKIKMSYHAEVLPKYPRFMVLSYKPTNYILRLLSKFN